MRLTRLQAVPVRLGFRGVFRTSHGTLAVPGRTAEHVYVRAETDTGLLGWGEARPSRKWSYETLESVTSTINRYFAPALLGCDPLDLAGLDAALSAEIAPGFTTGQPIARSGVEMAFWDLHGRHRGQSVNALLGGGAQREIRLSWTVLGAEPEAVAESVREGQARGYRHFNFKIGFGPEIDRGIARTVAELAPGAFLWADANQAYDVDGAVAAAKLLAEAGVALLEQPLPINRYLDYPELRRRSALPIGVDEGIYHTTDLEQLLRARSIDVFVVKIGRMGGIGPARRAIELAQAAGVRVLASGLTESDLALAAYAHLLAAMGIDSPCALNGRQLLSESVVTGLGGSGDVVPVPAGPGLGVTVDEARLAEARVALTCEPDA